MKRGTPLTAAHRERDLTTVSACAYMCTMKSGSGTPEKADVTLLEASKRLSIDRRSLAILLKSMGITPVSGKSAMNRMAMLLKDSDVRRIEKVMK